MVGTYYDYADTSDFSRIPSFTEGSFLRNADAAGAATVIQLTDLPEHESLDLEFVLAIIDRWDGNDPGEGPDSLRIEVDGTLVLNKTFSNIAAHGQSYAPSSDALLRSGTDLGFGAAADSLYDLTHMGACARSPIPAATAEIRIYAEGPNYGNRAESWAIDNFRIRLNDADGASISVLATDFDGGLPENFSGSGQIVPVEGFGATVTRVDEGVVEAGMWLDPATGFTDGDPATALSDSAAEFRRPLSGPVLLRPGGRRRVGAGRFRRGFRRRPSPVDRRPADPRSEPHRLGRSSRPESSSSPR